MTSILKYGVLMAFMLLTLKIPFAFSLSANTLYVEDPSSNLFTIDTTTGDATLVGPIGISDVTDIAFDGPALYGITFDTFITIDPDTGNGSNVGSLALSDFMNALVVDRNGTIYAAGVANGDFVRINTTTGVGTAIGNYGEGITSSGDLAFDSNDVLYASVKQPDPNTGEPLPNDWLARINLATGRATLIGQIGFEDVFGLSFRNGTLYGVTTSGQVLTIDTFSGAGTLAGSNSVTQWGASTSPGCSLPVFRVNQLKDSLTMALENVRDDIESAREELTITGKLPKNEDVLIEFHLDLFGIVDCAKTALDVIKNPNKIDVFKSIVSCAQVIQRIIEDKINANQVGRDLCESITEANRLISISGRGTFEISARTRQEELVSSGCEEEHLSNEFERIDNELTELEGGIGELIQILVNSCKSVP